MGFIREALALRPEGSFYYYLLAFGHYQLGEQDAAISHLETAQAFHPYIAEYFGLHAFVLLAQKNFDAALHKADEGLAQEADNLTCLNARSRALNGLRRTSEAIETMQDALAVDPHNELTHTTVAWNYLEKGTHKSAQHHFREALRLNPNSEGARAGLKEALKSNVAPYRWLLQYQFWLQHKGKKWQMAAPILLFVLFRLLGGLLDANQSTKGLVWVPVSIYLLLVVISWAIGPIANFMLLFNPLGKHALTTSERWQAGSVVASLCAGATCLLYALLAAADGLADTAFIGGLILFTLALPLGDVLFPLRWQGSSRRVKMAMLLAGFGFLALLSLVWMPQMLLLPALYGAMFILYNWSGLLR
jgi:Flp pilus assembly protein TadD